MAVLREAPEILCGQGHSFFTYTSPIYLIREGTIFESSKAETVTLKLKNPSYQEVSIPKAWDRLSSLWRQVGSCSEGRGMRLGWKWKAAFPSREEKLYRRW